MGGNEEGHASEPFRPIDHRATSPESIAPRACGTARRQGIGALADEIVGLVAASLAPERGERPVVYELARHHLVLISDSGIRLNPPLGDGTRRSSWTLPFDHEARPLRTNGAATAPGVCLVAVPNEHGPALLVDLVAAECAALVGPADDVTTILDALIRSASASRTRQAQLLVVGDLGPPRAPRVATLADAFATLAESTDPIVVFIRTPLADDDFERLVAAVHRHRSSAVVVATPHTAARAIVVAGRRDSCVVYVRVPEPPGAPGAAFSARVHPDALPERSAGSGPIEVAVLGPVEIRGSAIPLGRHPRLTELVVYLAMHPEGATTPAWETALWPERRMPPQTIANRLSEARRALGFSSDGRPRLRKSGERHRIAEVETDWERFQALAGCREDPAAWHKALELVRGRAFSDLHQGQWTALEGFVVEIEHAIVECALGLGRFALDVGRPDDAMWAAQRALRATPWDERLHRLLMEAADAAGDRAGVEATLRHLALVLEIDGDPLRGVHPETAALYARLSGRSAQMSSVG
ncbi:MAG TPA: bacterial transcriptional activator domain-containing protein [Acidimicrobiales bacterium]|nr:bacterial transcriptional activator domain-containing protein [Acidimicrobiales bacterium]